MVRPALIFMLMPGAASAQGNANSPSSAPANFFDKPNVVLLGSLTLWHGLDAYATERAIDHGGREMWPVARHFCGSQNGRIAYFGTNYASTIASSYLLYRTGHRKLARAMLVVGSVSSASGYAYTLTHTQGLPLR